MFKIKYIYKATRLDDTLINHTTIHPSIRPSVQHRYKSDGGKKTPSPNYSKHTVSLCICSTALTSYLPSRSLQQKASPGVAKKNQNKSLK